MEVHKANGRWMGRMGLGPCGFFVVAWATICVYPPVAQSQMLDRPYNVELGLECNQKDIRVGDEILITFVFTNRDPNVFRYESRSYDRSGRMPEYELAAKYSDGKPVPDPREPSFPAIGGGLGGGLEPLATGASYRRTLALNLWASITEPGRYVVTGTYHYWIEDKDKKPRKNVGTSTPIRLQSLPIEIEVKPRSRKEMGKYINQLTTRLKSLERGVSAGVRHEREHLLAQLAYTCDARVLPTMIDQMCKRRDGNEAFQAFQALWCYLPHTTDVRNAVLTAARTRPMPGQWASLLEHLSSPSEFAEIIREFLSSGDPKTVEEAIYAAQQHPADEYMPRLIAVATGTGLEALGLPKGIRREGAIGALAENRTDEGVAALKNLLNDPNEKIRKATSEVIRRVYRRYPIYPEQEDEAFTKAIVSVAMDPQDILRFRAVQFIAQTRTPAGVQAIKALLADPNANVLVAATDLGVRAIRDLLHDSDPSIRKHTRFYIEDLAYHEYPGRPLRADDFPSERETFEQFKQKTMEYLFKE